MRRLPLFILTCVVAAGPAVVAAQDRSIDPPAVQARPPQPRPTPPRAPATRRPPRGLRLYFVADTQFMTASQSFKAVVGSALFEDIGVGLDITNAWHDLFVRVAIEHGTRKGSRAFVTDSGPVSLNIPLTVGMTPLDLAAGWRFVRKPRVPRPGQPPPRVPPGPFRPSRYTFYGGGGASFLKYSEKSDFSTATDFSSKTFTGYVVFGGVEISLSRRFAVDVEGVFRGMPGAIGTEGVSKSYNETALSGSGLRLTIGYKRR